MAACQMRVSIIVAMTVVIVGAYGNKRDVVPSNADIMSYRKPRLRNFFLDRPFDKMIGQRSPRDVYFRDQPDYPPDFPISRYQSFKQNYFATFEDEPLFGDALPKNRELRGQRAVLRDNLFGGQSAPLAPEEIFEGGGRASTYSSRMPFKEQLFTVETPLKNLPRGQSLSSEQASFPKAAFDEIPFSAKFYRDDSYDKPIDSYGRYKDVRSLPYGESSYTEHGNDALGLSSLPMVSSSKHLFSLNTELFTTPSTPVHGFGSPMSSVSFSNDEAHEAYKMKFGPVPTLGMIASTSVDNCNALVDSSPTVSSGAATTIPSISVSANQSSIVGHILTSLTTKPNSPVTATATSIAPIVGNTHEPIHFHATKYGAVLTSLPTQNELKSNMHAYLLANAPKNSFKTNEHNLLVPGELKNNMKTDIQNHALNYILSEEYKEGLKGIQNSFPNYPLPGGLKHDWSSQLFSQPETSSSYAPLSPSGKAKLILPNMPVAPISSISWPMEMKSDISALLPAKSIMASDTATSNNMPLGINLPLDFMSNMPSSLAPSISNSISGSITGGISTGIPGSMTADMPTSIPTLSLGQTLHRAEQLRQTHESRNPWYPTGLQLQLGGFGGINYTLHTSNPAAKPMELGIAGAGLTPPKLPQTHAPAFAKIGVGYHL